MVNIIKTIEIPSKPIVKFSPNLGIHKNFSTNGKAVKEFVKKAQIIIDNTKVANDVLIAIILSIKYSFEGMNTIKVNPITGIKRL